MVCRDLDLLMESRIYLTYKMTNSPHDQNGEPSLVEASPQLSEEPLKIESLCMRCSENGTTMLLAISIPHFKNVMIMAFECPHCGFRNSELQPMQICEDKGIHMKLTVPEGRSDVLSRQIVKSDKCAVRIPELDLEMPGTAQKGILTTIEGLLRNVAIDLMDGQDLRRQSNPETASKIDVICQQLESFANGDHSFTIELRDPSGNSFIETPFPSIDHDDLLKRTFYERTAEEARFLGLVVQDEREGVHHGANARGFALSDTAVANITNNAFVHRYSAPEEVMIFPGRCLVCQKETETRMYPTKIPYFKEVIIMSNACDECGYKNSELRPGGGISPKGRILRLNVLNQEDLNRDVIKSDSASLEIPDLELKLSSGAGLITTVEGLIARFINDLKTMYSFKLGDSAEKNEKEKFEQLFSALEKLLECTQPWTLILKDPLSNSFILPLTERMEDDSQLSSEEYERSAEENEEYGIDVLEQTESQSHSDS